MTRLHRKDGPGIGAITTQRAAPAVGRSSSTSQVQRKGKKGKSAAPRWEPEIELTPPTKLEHQRARLITLKIANPPPGYGLMWRASLHDELAAADQLRLEGIDTPDEAEAHLRITPIGMFTPVKVRIALRVYNEVEGGWFYRDIELPPDDGALVPDATGYLELRELVGKPKLDATQLQRARQLIAELDTTAHRRAFEFMSAGVREQLDGAGLIASQVVVHTVAVNPGMSAQLAGKARAPSYDIAAQFAAANKHLAPHFEVERGRHAEIDGESILGDDSKLEMHSRGRDNKQHMSDEMKRLVAEHREDGRLTAYFVPDFNGEEEQADGSSIQLQGLTLSWMWSAMKEADPVSIILTEQSNQRVLGHEVGHALGLQHSSNGSIMQMGSGLGDYEAKDATKSRYIETGKRGRDEK